MKPTLFRTTSLLTPSWGLLLMLLTLPTACGKSTGTPDGGSDAGQHSPVDAGHPVDAGPVDAGPIGLPCSKLLACDEPCTTDACTNACYAESTAVGQGLFNALTDCINASCSSGDGGPCASSSSQACSNCNEQAATGACIANLEGCENDNAEGPPDPDGGAIVPDAGPQEATLNCGGLIACVANCGLDAGNCLAACSGHATPEAAALAENLNGCLATACPSTDGGPCATPGEQCDGCVDQAEYALPDTCATPFVACNTDLSNSPDAGTAPRALNGGTLATLVTGIVQPASSVVVRDGYLYYCPVDSNTQISRVKLGDGGTTTLVGPPQQGPVGLAVDANNLYVWSTGSFSGTTSINNDNATIVEIALDGGAAVTLEQDMEVFYNVPYLNSVAVDSQSVYWLKGGVGYDGVIMKTAIGNPNPVPLYTHQALPEALITDGTNLYWTDWGTFDANGNSNNDGTVWQGSVDGGTPLLLASNQSAPSSIALDSSNVYWTNSGRLGGGLLPAPDTGSLMQVAIGGGTPIALAKDQAVPLGIATAAGLVFWTEYGLSAPGLVLSVPVGGGTVVPLVGGLPDPYSLTVAGDTLYWTNTPSSDGNGTLMSLTPF